MNKNNLTSSRSFLTGIIDYAGLFPPANLHLKEAFENYLLYSKSVNSYMLSRFICPVKLFKELGKLSVNSESEIYLSVLGRGGYNINDFNENLSEDIIMWKEFVKNTNNRFITDAFEIKLPDELITEHKSGKVSEFIDIISQKIRSEFEHPVFMFFEGHIGSEWQKNVKCLIEGINIHNKNNNDSGFKLRTGGVETYSFPEPGQIAFSIRECLDNAIRMKCTAGLHHPFRHFDKNIGTKMHGFVNVFGAGVIAMRHNISDYGLREILSDENPDNFVFTDEYFSWKDWKINIDEINLARKDLMISFGSCSFDEPVEDLKNLNLL